MFSSEIELYSIKCISDLQNSSASLPELPHPPATSCSSSNRNNSSSPSSPLPPPPPRRSSLNNRRKTEATALPQGRGGIRTLLKLSLHFLQIIFSSLQASPGGSGQGVPLRPGEQGSQGSATRKQQQQPERRPFQGVRLQRHSQPLRGAGSGRRRRGRQEVDVQADQEAAGELAMNL